jgi:hypothetical protein
MNEQEMIVRLEILEKKIDDILGMLPDVSPPWYETIPDVGVRCWMSNGTDYQYQSYVVVAYHEGTDHPFEIKSPCPGIWYGPMLWKKAKPVNSIF